MHLRGAEEGLQHRLGIGERGHVLQHELGVHLPRGLPDLTPMFAGRRKGGVEAASLEENHGRDFKRELLIAVPKQSPDPGNLVTMNNWWWHNISHPHRKLIHCW